MEHKAKEIIRDLYEKNTGIKLNLDQVFLVWFCKALQNWKALVITRTPDSLFYELTYNGDKQEIYVDTYVKQSNEVISCKAN